jgi:hypothetical protein
MGNQRLVHDAAWVTALSIMEMMENVLRPEERKDAFQEIYLRVKAGMEALEQQAEREAARLCRPSRN